MPDRIALAAAVLVAAVVAVMFRDSYVNTDSTWALYWPTELLHGRPLTLDQTLIPTPHPLLNVVALTLGLPGRWFGYESLRLLILASYAALLLGVFVLGHASLGWPTGAAAFVLTATSPVLLERATAAYQDVPFAALCVWGGVAVATRPARPAAAFVLLTLAGLLRPEAWGFALAYLAYHALLTGPRAALRWTPAALAAPVLWILLDWALTGDPLFSLTVTQEGAERLDRATGIGSVPATLFDGLSVNLSRLTVALCAIGAIAALVVRRRAALVPVGIGVVALGAFVALGAAEVSLLPRYLMFPAAMFALGAGYALTGWRDLDPALVRQRTAWMAAAACAALVIVTSLAGRVDRVEDLRAGAADNAKLVRDLRSLLDTVPDGCAVTFPVGRVRPLAAYLSGRYLDSFPSTPAPRGLNVVVTAPREDLRPGFLFTAAGPGAPPSGRLKWRNASWGLTGTCRRQAGSPDPAPR